MAALAAGTAFMAQVLAGDGRLATVEYWTITIGGAVATAAAVVLQYRKVRIDARHRTMSEDSVIRQVREARTELYDAVGDVLDLLCEIRVAPDRDARLMAQSRMEQAVTAAAVRAIAGDRGGRASFFRYDVQLRRLQLTTYSGRVQRPAFILDEESFAGRFVLSKVVAQGRAEFVHDVETECLPEWGRECGFSTFIVAPVANEKTVFGVLAVDCPMANDLNEEDKPLLALLGKMLGAGLSDGELGTNAAEIERSLRPM